MIDNSQSDLHEMFVLTYGTLYEQYKDMFEDLFSSFRNYYHGVELDLEQVMIIMIIIIMIMKITIIMMIIVIKIITIIMMIIMIIR